MAPDAQTPARHRILLVEDNADGREMMATILGQYGHEVMEAGDGIEGDVAFDRQNGRWRVGQVHQLVDGAVGRSRTEIDRNQQVGVGWQLVAVQRLLVARFA